MNLIQPTIFHAVVEESAPHEPLDDKANFYLDNDKQIHPLAKKIKLIDSVVQALLKMDFKNNNVWVLGRTRDDIMRYGITFKWNPEHSNTAIIDVLKYRSLMTLPLQNPPKYREFLILILPKQLNDVKFISTDLDLRSLSTFKSHDSSESFIDSYIKFEKNVRGTLIR